MNKHKIIYWIGTIILFLGMFFAFLPHVYHEKIGFNESSHLIHTIVGISTAIIGLIILILNEKNLSNKKN